MFQVFNFSAQVEHANHNLEESERVLNERIFKLEGRRIQVEEVRLYVFATQCRQTHLIRVS